ncbi:MAG: histidine kinase [Pyrinomonadaceae bacterium]|nr:histidine kinase [Pyrinomonadaceae bacterium]
MFILFLLFSINQYNQTGNWQFLYFTGNALQWQIFTGITIYATIVSIVYVLQVVQNLREEERRAARAETLYAQNSLAVLQAQLNPHFLFNTLHTLMALVRYDPEKAENALEKLAEMLRYSLKDKRESKNYLVRLEEELNFVENYLELEKLRLGDRLTIEKNIENEARNCLLPAFTIQPLIENSIKHGIALKSISATIRISAKRENSFLKIKVGDDGIGSNAESVNESGGLGINLVREQLQIQYGEGSKFEIETKANKGFKVNIEIPAQFAEKRVGEKVLEVEYPHVNS